MKKCVNRFNFSQSSRATAAAFFIAALWCAQLSAAPSKQWDKRFGGTDDDRAYAVKQTSDGGYVIAGASDSMANGDKTQDSRGNTDFWIVKTNNIGTKQWDKRFGGINSEYALSVRQAADGGYVVAGQSDSDGTGDKSEPSHGIFDCWVVKVHGPAVNDFDGDNKSDIGCYDAAGHLGQPAGSWYFMGTTNGFFTRTFGYNGTVPVVGDFDGDGTYDYGCYDAAGHYGQPQGSWYFMTSTSGFFTKTFGYSGTVPVAGDFDGDGTCDYGCYDAVGNFGQPAGSWYLMQSTSGFITRNFGYAGTVPVGPSVTQ